MVLGVLDKLSFPLDSPLDFLRWHNSLFDYPMRYDSGGVAVKKVQHPVVDALEADTQLIDLIPQIVSFIGEVRVPALAGDQF
jgi:hypothetical protein